MKISILVLNYNGKTLLEEYLASISRAAEGSAHDCKVYVVDNQSSDGSVGFLKENFPGVSVMVAEENRVLCSYNEAVKKVDGDIVIFLNNDMKVKADFIDHLIRHFERKDVMFAAPRVMNFDDTYNGGRSYFEFKKGAVKMIVDADNYMSSGRTHAISTGAFRKDLFMELGGFDEIYLPGIWEDVDICLRGLLLGWKGVYEPESVIWHDESTTFHREYGEKGKLKIAHRNMFLFAWKNITEPGMFLKHLVLTLPRAAALFLRGRTEVMEGLVAAFRKMPLVVRKRKEMKEEFSSRKLKMKDLISSGLGADDPSVNRQV